LVHGVSLAPCPAWKLAWDAQRRRVTIERSVRQACADTVIRAPDSSAAACCAAWPTGPRQ
ncbi:MAG: hypothetical protein LC644_04340, partial [Pseudonocardia sp.]|nr:hypothetical protein [Pseudonocardia sp.]